MRQDPDIMLIGEIRDEETASIAVRASITGHLVLSTLHTNNAVTTVPRLLDFNVDPTLLASSLLAAISQRLVRKLCPECKEEGPLSEELRQRLLYAGIKNPPQRAFSARGCPFCNWTGYIGRTAIGEVMVVNDRIRELISDNAPVHRIYEEAVSSGMTPLIQDGMRRVMQGLTSVEEVLRVAG